MASKKPPKDDRLTLNHLVKQELRLKDEDIGRNIDAYLRENSSDPKLRGALMDELKKLAAGSVQHTDKQRERAKLPRKSRDGERLTRDVVAQVVNRPEFRDYKPGELLPHVRAAIELNEQSAPLTDKWLRELIGAARRNSRR